jgi:serine/threonine protein kinase
MSAQPPIDRQTFLEYLLQSGLMNEPEVAELATQFPDSTSGRAVARALVEQGYLTRFQAERLLAGRTVGFVLGQYRILDQLGKGGMGRVFKAMHFTMGRVVALKVLAPQLLKTANAQLLFRREMRAIAQLSHPNLVTAYDADQIGNRYFLVMEYVDGPNLEQFVRERGPLPAGLACEFMRQVADGLQFAADMGMVHRDIKPSNLLVQFPRGDGARRPCIVKILDFGLARLQSGSDGGPGEMGTIVSRPDLVMGTPDFVSPEQARDLHSVDIRSDLYSLGCTFYFLLTAQVPFPKGSPLEKLVRHSTQEPVPVESLRPETPAEVAAIVRRLMAKEPANRFQTAAELAASLKPHTAEAPVDWAASRLATIDNVEPAAALLKWDEVFASPPPEAPADVEPEPGLDVNDELSALGSTFPPDPTPTLLSDPGLFPSLRPRHDLADPRRIKVALIVAVAVVAGLLGLIAVFGQP